jgi:hypothetical protein
MQPTGSEAILTPITPAAIFLTLTVNPGREDEVRDVLSDVSGLRRSVGGDGSLGIGSLRGTSR